MRNEINFAILYFSNCNIFWKEKLSFFSIKMLNLFTKFCVREALITQPNWSKTDIERVETFRSLLLSKKLAITLAWPYDNLTFLLVIVLLTDWRQKMKGVLESVQTHFWLIQFRSQRSPLTKVDLLCLKATQKNLSQNWIMLVILTINMFYRTVGIKRVFSDE